MVTEQLSRAGWGAYFDQLSKSLPQANAELRISSQQLGSQLEADWMKLNGISFDHHNDIIVISMQGLEHIIHAPATAYAQLESGRVENLEITDAQGERCLLHLRWPRAGKDVDEVIDEAGEETFPASDPPPWAGA